MLIASSSTTGFESVPIPLISTSTTSPETRKRCGSRFHPTPAGVPVLMTSPGFRGYMVDRYSMSFSILKSIKSIVVR